MVGVHSTTCKRFASSAFIRPHADACPLMRQTYAVGESDCGRRVRSQGSLGAISPEGPSPGMCWRQFIGPPCLLLRNGSYAFVDSAGFQSYRDGHSALRLHERCLCPKSSRNWTF